jgi:hypothetical protein
MFVITMTAGSEGARQRNGPPEKLCGGVVLGISGHLVDALKADDLRYLRIGVQPIQVVPAFGERPQDRLVTKTIRNPPVLSIAGHAVQICEDLVHPAMLSFEHRLELRIGKRLHSLDRPICKPQQDRSRRVAVRQ